MRTKERKIIDGYFIVHYYDAKGDNHLNGVLQKKPGREWHAHFVRTNSDDAMYCPAGIWSSKKDACGELDHIAPRLGAV